MSYNPELWCALKITPPDGNIWYRLFGMWRGGFATSDNWRVNSGITKIEDDGEFYSVYGESGSCYTCHKQVENLDPPGYFGSVLYSWQQHALEQGGNVEVVPINQVVTAL